MQLRPTQLCIVYWCELQFNIKPSLHIHRQSNFAPFSTARGYFSIFLYFCNGSELFRWINVFAAPLSRENSSDGNGFFKKSVAHEVGSFLYSFFTGPLVNQKSRLVAIAGHIFSLFLELHQHKWNKCTVALTSFPFLQMWWCLENFVTWDLYKKFTRLLFSFLLFKSKSNYSPTGLACCSSSPASFKLKMRHKLVFLFKLASLFLCAFVLINYFFFSFDLTCIHWFIFRCTYCISVLFFVLF